MKRDEPESVTEQVQDGIEQLADDDADSTNSDVRYMAYGARLRTALRAGTRYVAYTSDIGEAFRPVVAPWIVSAAYGVSWLYLFGDVGFETWKAKRFGPTPVEAAVYTEEQRLALVAAKRGTFQAIASMGLPALTIHTVVAQSKRFFRNSLKPRVVAWGPTMTGLAVVPVLPFLFDKPVEKATDRAFEMAESWWLEHRAKNLKASRDALQPETREEKERRGKEL